MGFMDKAKEAALQAKASAQQIAQQGQAKVAQVQQTRSEGELYRSLGEAFYAEQRRGGDQQTVIAALTALDEHFAAAPPAAPGPVAPAGAGGAVAPPPPAPPAPATPAPTGDFTLDDL
jgi:hypothetical protein